MVFYSLCDPFHGHNTGDEAFELIIQADENSESRSNHKSNLNTDTSKILNCIPTKNFP